MGLLGVRGTRLVAAGGGHPVAELLDDLAVQLLGPPSLADCPALKRLALAFGYGHQADEVGQAQAMAVPPAQRLQPLQVGPGELTRLADHFGVHGVLPGHLLDLLQRHGTGMPADAFGAEFMEVPEATKHGLVGRRIFQLL